MAILIGNNGDSITPTSNPSINNYVLKYGEWINVLSAGGKINSDGIVDNKGKLFHRLGPVALDAYGEPIEFPNMILSQYAREFINNEIEMEVIGYITMDSKHQRTFWGLNRKKILIIDQRNEKIKKSWLGLGTYFSNGIALVLLGIIFITMSLYPYSGVNMSIGFGIVFLLIGLILLYLRSSRKK